MNVGFVNKSTKGDGEEDKEQQRIVIDFFKTGSALDIIQNLQGGDSENAKNISKVQSQRQLNHPLGYPSEFGISSKNSPVRHMKKIN